MAFACPVDRLSIVPDVWDIQLPVFIEQHYFCQGSDDPIRLKAVFHLNLSDGFFGLFVVGRTGIELGVSDLVQLVFQCRNRIARRPVRSGPSGSMKSFHGT